MILFINFWIVFVIYTVVYLLAVFCGVAFCLFKRKPLKSLEDITVYWVERIPEYGITIKKFLFGDDTD